jgi:hypothetical protein
MPAKHARPQLKRPVGRPEHVPTPDSRNLVRLKAAAGYSHKEIAKFVGCDPKTLRKVYRDELNNGKAFIFAKIKERSLHDAVTSSNPLPRIFVLNNPEKFDFAPPVIEAPTTGMKISWARGGPGRRRAEEYTVETDPNIGLPEGADRLATRGDPVHQPAEIKISDTATLITRAEAPKPTTREQWETLGLSADEFNRRTQPTIAQEIICVGRPACCPCKACVKLRANFGHSHEQAF